MQITLDIPATKSTPEMIRIMEKICKEITPENLRIVEEKLKKLGAEKLNSKLKTGLSFI
ncbi:MAG TPA: hypothetical protein VGF79_08735 [Bacteroidia bacterium]